MTADTLLRVNDGVRGHQRLSGPMLVLARCCRPRFGDVPAPRKSRLTASASIRPSIPQVAGAHGATIRYRDRIECGSSLATVVALPSFAAFFQQKVHDRK